RETTVSSELSEPECGSGRGDRRGIHRLQLYCVDGRDYGSLDLARDIDRPLRFVLPRVWLRAVRRWSDRSVGPFHVGYDARLCFWPWSRAALGIEVRRRPPHSTWSE